MIHRSPYPPIPLTNESITERVFRGLGPDPDRVVLIDGPSGRELTAGGFVAGVRRLAGGLRARGIGRGDVVAILAPNMPEYAVVFHGVAFAGAAVTTINPTYTAPEVSHQLADAGVGDAGPDPQGVPRVSGRDLGGAGVGVVRSEQHGLLVVSAVHVRRGESEAGTGMLQKFSYRFAAARGGFACFKRFV